MQDTAASFDQLQGLDSQLQQLILRSYIGRADKVVVVMDTSFSIKLINDFGCQLLGKQREQVEGRAWLREFLPKEYREEVREDYERLLRTGSQEPARNEFAIRVGDGVSGVHAWQHFLVKDDAGKAQALLSVGEDVTEQKAVQTMLQRRNAILEALSMASDLFLTATPDVWEHNVIEVLRALGEARGSERVYACKNRKTKDGRQATFLKYEWKVTGESKVFKGEETQFKVLEEVGLGRWAKKLAANEMICESVAQMPEEERAWNMTDDTQSVVVIPVFVGEEWWGYMTFEDWQPDRACPPSELEALKAVALTFGQAIRRKRIEEELRLEKESVEEKVQERTQELQQAQEELKEAMVRQLEGKARLTASIHSVSLGFVVTGLSREVLLFNHAVNELLGASEEGWTWEILKSRFEGTVDLDSMYDECLREVKEIVVNEVTLGDKYLRLNLTPIKLVEGDGRVIGVVVLVTDISEQKRLEKARDEFFAVASHELRTPLTAIRGNASMMLDYYGENMQGTEMKDMVQDVYDSSVRLIDIVNEYLDASRFEMNKYDTKNDVFDILILIREVMQQLRATAQERKLEWVLEVEEGRELWVQADRQKTEQVLVNLLGNALKYTETGGVYVKVEDGQEMGKVLIYDTGRGISEEERPLLFEKFRQVGDRVYTQDHTKGTGMGLYITRLMTEAMGGKVYLGKSEKGKGSEFVVELRKG